MRRKPNGFITSNKRHTKGPKRGKRKRIPIMGSRSQKQGQSFKLTAKTVQKPKPHITAVRLRRAEGPSSEPLVGTWIDFKSIDKVNAHLKHNTKSMPEEQQGTDKYDFKIVWSDGVTYEGRYDLHRQEVKPDLRRHIQDYYRFWESKKSDKMEHLSREERNEIRKEYRIFHKRIEEDFSKARSPKVKEVPNIAVPLSKLQAHRDKKWKEIHTMEEKAMREGWSNEKAHRERIKIVKKYEYKQPDMTPLIYRTSIGHYGGLYVDVPAEKFELFKANIPPKMFPKQVKTTDVREALTVDGEARFRKRFPNSNIIKEVYFSSNSKGMRYLDFLDMPRSE